MEAWLATESLPELFRTLVWWLLAFCVLSYFIGSYLFEVLAQKLGEARWMAWVPIANLYLGLRLIGWGGLFWLLLGGYAVGLLGMLLPGPLSMLSALVLIPTVLAVGLLGLVYWPLLARRRELPLWIGLLVLLPNLTPLLEFALSETALVAVWLATTAAGFAAFLWIVFHDGGPESPPHPVGFALTGVGAVLSVVLALKLPVWMEERGAFEQMQVALASARAEASAGDATGSDDLAAFLAGLGGAGAGDASEEADAPPSSGALVMHEPAPHAVADRCPPDTREAGARPPQGREWWCERETAEGWVRHGPSRRWLHARAVGEEGAYENGARQGTWTRYWRTGGRHTQAEFRDGAQHGWMHRWDEAGRLESQTWYEDGEPAPLSMPGPRAAAR
jgi:hypothetical protein